MSVGQLLSALSDLLATLFHPSLYFTLEGEIGGLSQRAFFSSGICFYLADKKHQKGIGRKRERLACLSSHLRDPVGLPQGCGCRLSPDQRLEPPSGSLCTGLSPSLSLTLFLSPLKIILPLPLCIFLVLNPRGTQLLSMFSL